MTKFWFHFFYLQVIFCQDVVFIETFHRCVFFQFDRKSIISGSPGTKPWEVSELLKLKLGVRSTSSGIRSSLSSKSSWLWTSSFTKFKPKNSTFMLGLKYNFLVSESRRLLRWSGIPMKNIWFGQKWTRPWTKRSSSLTVFTVSFWIWVCEFWALILLDYFSNLISQQSPLHDTVALIP